MFAGAHVGSWHFADTMGCSATSAFGSKTDIAEHPQMSANDPARNSQRRAFRAILAPGSTTS